MPINEDPLLNLKLPLRAVSYQPKTDKGKVKMFTLNLNQYRNTHPRLLNNAKIDYKHRVLEAMEGVWEQGNPITRPVFLVFNYWAATKRKIDVSNPCSIIDKFGCDAITEAGFWPDDNNDFVKGVMYWFSGVDKNDPRCDLTIYDADYIKYMLVDKGIVQCGFSH